MSTDWPLSFIKSFLHFIDFGLVRNSRDYSINHSIRGTFLLQIRIARRYEPFFVAVRVSFHDELKKVIDVGPFSVEKILA